MKCPTLKCKGGIRIETRRTDNEGNRIRRERYCPKCKKKFFTFEYTEHDYSKMVIDYEARIDNLDGLLRNARAEHSQLTGTVISLLHQVGIEPKKNGKANGKGSKTNGYCGKCGDETDRPGGLCADCLDPIDIGAG